MACRGRGATPIWQFAAASFKADCLWRRQGVIVELDGREVHGTAHAFEADRERDRLLVGEGWRVIHLTWLQVRDDAPEIAADLRRALAQDLPET